MIPHKQNSILIVEDDEDIRSALVELLEMEDYQVATVVDGLEAMEYFEKNNPPKIILLDLSLPKITGSELMKLINQRDDRDQIRVIVASGGEDLHLKFKEMKADGFIKKPYDINLLLAKIKNK